MPTVAAPAAPVKAPASAVFDGALAARLPLRILVAEDNEVNQRVVLLMLRSFGYTADVVGNGLEAVAAIQRQAYDVVLMDIQMPEMDGLEATRAIRAGSSPTPRPRIIGLSANAMSGDLQAAKDAGMDDYLPKPMTPAGLRAMLEKWAATT
jgi:CheY-like chemotaxis protein